jgi:ATP-binding cassette subfamily D (ALD) protein 2
VAIGFIIFKYKQQRQNNQKLKKYASIQQSKFQTIAKVKQPAFDKQFFNEIKYLIKIMFPRLISKQIAYLIFHTVALVSRTFISIYVAKLEGSLVKSIVKKNFKDFFFNLIKWLGIAVPATSCNSLIKYLESKLDLELRISIIKKSLEMYFDKRIYYKIALKQYDNIQIDQNLSEDVDKLTSLFVHLYSHLTKVFFFFNVYV